MKNLVEKYPKLFEFIWIKSDGKKIIIGKPFWVFIVLLIIVLIPLCSKQEEIVQKAATEKTESTSKQVDVDINVIRKLKEFTKGGIPLDNIKGVEIQGGLALLVSDNWLFWYKDDKFYCGNGSAKQISPRNLKNESICEQAPQGIDMATVKKLLSQ